MYIALLMHLNPKIDFQDCFHAKRIDFRHLLRISECGVFSQYRESRGQ